MDLLTGETLSVVWRIIWGISVLFGAIKAIQAFTGWVIAWNSKRTLAWLRKRRDRLIQLHQSDREYYGWLLSGVLWVLWPLALQLAIEGLRSPPQHWSPELQLIVPAVVNFLRTLLGMTAFVIASRRLGDYRALQRFDRTIASLDHAIAKLEAKRSLQPAPSAG